MLSAWGVCPVSEVAGTVIIIPVVQMRKLRYRDEKPFAQGLQVMEAEFVFRSRYHILKSVLYVLR